MGNRSAKSRTGWCVPQASDVLEMSEREGSDVLGVREDRGSTHQPTREVPGSGGGETSKHSAEVDASQERDKDVPQYSAEDGFPQRK